MGGGVPDSAQSLVLSRHPIPSHCKGGGKHGMGVYLGPPLLAPMAPWFEAHFQCSFIPMAVAVVT